ncbi:MAG: transcriptional regulator with XRE-family HTH domain [Alteromonadaceae bacterium]|jgi:transcriptional regulator with XRE-family HTH domain
MVDDHDIIKKAMGERIRAARKSLALNQAEFARMVGVSPQAAAQWELGEFQPRGDNLTKASEVLQTTPQFIQFGITPQANMSVDLQAVLKSESFKQAFNAAFAAMVKQGADLEWISCANANHIEALADITLANLRQELNK